MEETPSEEIKEGVESQRLGRMGLGSALLGREGKN